MLTLAQAVQCGMTEAQRAIAAEYISAAGLEEADWKDAAFGIVLVNSNATLAKVQAFAASKPEEARKLAQKFRAAGIGGLACEDDKEKK